MFVHATRSVSNMVRFLSVGAIVGALHFIDIHSGTKFSRDVDGEK